MGRGLLPWTPPQLARREQISMLPPALELLPKVESELARIWALPTESEVRSRILALNAEIAKVNRTATEGPPTRLAPLEVEGIVAEWRARRPGSR